MHYYTPSGVVLNTSKELVPAKSTVTVVILPVNEPNLDRIWCTHSYIARLTRRGCPYRIQRLIGWKGVRLFTTLHPDFDQDVVYTDSIYREDMMKRKVPGAQSTTLRFDGGSAKSDNVIRRPKLTTSYHQFPFVFFFRSSFNLRSTDSMNDHLRSKTAHSVGWKLGRI